MRKITDKELKEIAFLISRIDEIFAHTRRMDQEISGISGSEYSKQQQKICLEKLEKIKKALEY